MEYFSKVGGRLFTIRLLIEGACDLYEADAQTLFNLGLEQDKLEAAGAFDTVGEALMEIRVLIQQMQIEHMREAKRTSSIRSVI